MDFLELCLEQNIPFIQINTDLNRQESLNLGYVGQDSFQSGVLAGKLLDMQLGHKSQVCIIHLEDSIPNAHHLMAKEEGFREYFSRSSKKDVEIIQLSFSPAAPQTELYQYLNENLAKLPYLEAIFVTTSRAYMIADFLKNSDKEHIKLTGFDLISRNIELLAEGRIEFLINQNPVKQGYLGIMNIVEHLIKKAEIDKIINVPLDVVVKENYQYYLRALEDLKVLV